MDKYLTQLGGMEAITYSLPNALRNVVYSDFVDNNDCITLAALNDDNPVISNDRDKCWWEYNETNFHPDWFGTDDELDYLRAAITCAKILATRLNIEYPEKEFRMYVTFFETDPDDEDGVPGSATVRFHQIRNNINLLLGAEENPIEAVMEIEL